MRKFDLIDYQEQARNASAPKKLYELWDEVCQNYDKRWISEYELSEMKDIIFTSLNHLSKLKLLIESDESRIVDFDAYRNSRTNKAVNE